jgi:prepilin-type N-terminal cleavage/methylation domain-containing protein
MSFPLVPRGRCAFKAFTLIELLTVIAIIGILAAITFGVVKGVQNRAAISQCRTELGVLAQSLEAYKKQYGDYPQTGVSGGIPTAIATKTSAEGYLFNALLGKIGPKLDPIQGKQFTEASKFTLQSTVLPTAGNNTSVANAFLDPWGKLYLYYYRSNAAGASSWAQPSYILVSAGPDGGLGITVSATTGAITDVDNTLSADNIYANR